MKYSREIATIPHIFLKCLPDQNQAEKLARLASFTGKPDGGEWKDPDIRELWEHGRQKSEISSETIRLALIQAPSGFFLSDCDRGERAPHRRMLAAASRRVVSSRSDAIRPPSNRAKLEFERQYGNAALRRVLAN